MNTNACTYANNIHTPNYTHTHICIHTRTDEVAQVKTEATAAAKTMNLSVIRLCFQAFLMDEHGRFTIPVDPVFTHKVYDSSKSAGHSTHTWSRV